MSKTLRTVLAVTGAHGLPLACRLKGHTWRSSGNNTQTPTRKTCPKCQTIDLPMP